MDEDLKLNSDLPGVKWDNDKSPADGILVEIDHGPGRAIYNVDRSWAELERKHAPACKSGGGLGY